MKKGFFVVVISILSAIFLLIFPGVIRAYSIALDFCVSHAAFFVTTYFLIKKFPQHRNKIIISFVLTVVSIYSLICFAAHEIHTTTIPNFIAFIFGSINGYIFYILASKKWKCILILVSTVVCIFYYFWGMDYWLNKENHGTFTGIVNEKGFPDWTAHIQPIGDTLVLKDKKRLVLLDFFNTRCSVCFKEFPVLERIYNTYKTNKHISIYAIDIPFPQDTPGMAIQLVRHRKYTFPVLVGDKQLEADFSIQGYPTVILMKDSTVIFRGSIEFVDDVIEEQLRKN